MEESGLERQRPPGGRCLYVCLYGRDVKRLAATPRLLEGFGGKTRACSMSSSPGIEDVLREAKKKSACEREKEPVEPAQDVLSSRAFPTVRITALGGVERDNEPQRMRSIQERPGMPVAAAKPERPRSGPIQIPESIIGALVPLGVQTENYRGPCGGRTWGRTQILGYSSDPGRSRSCDEAASWDQPLSWGGSRQSGPALRAKTAGVVGVPPVISTRHARRRTFGIEFRRHRATSAGPLAPKPGDSLLAQYGL
jgi:hypothetical protein